MIIINEKNEIGIDDEGFMEELDFNTYIAKAYSSEFDFVRQVNEYMYCLYGMIAPQNTDVIGCFLAGTYNKIHKTIQAAVILASRGLNEQVKILIRSILDKLMIMQAVCNDNHDYNRWMEHQQHEKNRLIRDIKNDEPGLGHLKESIPADKSLPKGKYTSQKKWAELADMKEEYNVVYRLFSGNVHYSLNSLEEDIYLENGLPHIMDIGPKYDETRQLIITLATDALRAAKIVIDFFDVDDVKFRALNSNLEKRQEELLTEFSSK